MDSDTCHLNTLNYWKNYFFLTLYSTTGGKGYCFKAVKKKMFNLGETALSSTGRLLFVCAGVCWMLHGPVSRLINFMIGSVHRSGICDTSIDIGST